MVSLVEIQTMNIVSTSTPPSLPVGSAITSRTGRMIGTRHYCGTKSASEIKAVGKRLGYKGAKLATYVREALTNEVANRAVTVAAGVAALTSQGYVADDFVVKAKSACVRFVKPAEPKVKVVKEALAAVEAERDSLQKELDLLKAAMSTKA